MKRFCLLIALVLFTPFAHASEGISFSIGGHRVHLDSTRCRALSCVSVSDRSRRDDGGDNGRAMKLVPASATTATIPAATSARTPPAPAPALSPASPPIIVDRPVPAAAPLAAAPQLSAPPPPRVMTIQPAPVVAAPPPLPAATAHPIPPAVVHVSRETADEPDDGPIGDWQTESDSLVRVRLCGNALCGYALDKTTRDLGEAVLINMKPKQDTRWSGSVFSQDGGNVHYGTIELKGADRLRVEACVLGRFYCTGADWVRVSRSRQRVITERARPPEPRS
ncbi:DUF2147 domain-containing protein [Bradyrhizobium acaciae]|uniref:DUF2147 domain-containing protein n=1 Tax=Bradyrhizobium acaciae TaxID=2683706 RepID=UPI001E31885E|nr:DUF2147 domain-containing protein [Bradyrhizobium acaciae]MCC8982052.1 DUF2147 domain-containing protein [Bradyrhizobium acaciae]